MTPELEAGERVRIAVWSGPRNLSTALMRSWEHRGDTEVMDEPLYAHYLAVTGLDHPMADAVIAAGPVDEATAIAACVEAPEVAEISYQKHMAHHLLPGMDREWLGALRHILLIRHPARVLVSYLRKRAEVTVEDLGLPQQLELLERFGDDVLVIDSDDFLRDPPAYLAEMCRRTGVRFDDELEARMTSWPSGPRDSDGVWARHWYDAVWRSTGFGPEPGPLPETPISEPYRAVYESALSAYEQLALRRWISPTS